MRDEAGLKYDLVERGEGLAVCLDGVAMREAVQGWLSADQGQGALSSAVVVKASGKTSTVRTSRGRTGVVKVLQMGRSR